MLTITWFRSDQNWMPQQTNWRACNFRTHWKSSSAWLPAIWAVALACRSTRSNTSLYHHQTDSDYSSFAPRFDSWPEIANQSCNCKRRAFSRQSNQAKPSHSDIHKAFNMNPLFPHPPRNLLAAADNIRSASGSPIRSLRFLRGLHPPRTETCNYFRSASGAFLFSSPHCLSRGFHPPLVWKVSVFSSHPWQMHLSTALLIGEHWMGPALNLSSQ